MTDQKNLLLAIVLSIAILLGYNMLVEQPRIDEQQQAAEQQKIDQQSPHQAIEVPAAPAGPQAGAPAESTGAVPQATEGPRLGVDTSIPTGRSAAEDRAKALKATPRVIIETDRLIGSIALEGARFDDLVLKDYRETLDPESPQIGLFQPLRSARPYYAEFGWIGKNVKLPGRDTVWTASGGRLSQDTPVTLSWNNGEGLVFEQRIAIDRDYMFEVTQRVRNKTAAPVSLAPYGLISRTGTPDILGYYILHEGLLGVFDETLTEVDYDDLIDEGEINPPIRQVTIGGWIGITDKYWLAALVPDQQQRVNTSFSAGRRNNEAVYQTDYLGATVAIPAGGKIENINRLFAGAKEVHVIDRYAEEIGIDRFDLSVDWGWFYFLTKPLFFALDWLNGLVGNFGLAILLVTVGIKIAFFPLANKSYRAMGKMKLLQPKIVEMRERFGDDKQRMNQEMMALYKKENVNPASGCLPMIIQIPVFFSLYKVLFVSIEMRQAPFFGWIEDLSARDPLSMLTAFGLIDWNVPASLDVVNIGLWPVIMGITMFLQMRLNPAPADPIQAKIFMFMPLMFTFILAPFPAGLVIYWAWNNVLSMGQQWVIMKRHGLHGKSVSKKTT